MSAESRLSHQFNGLRRFPEGRICLGVALRHRGCKKLTAGETLSTSREFYRGAGVVHLRTDPGYWPNRLPMT
jgi:hypothetical protein